MTKFRCIKGSAAVPVGTIIVGELEGERIRLTENSTVRNADNIPYFVEGEMVPLTGYVWGWESCERELDREELLERFEAAVDAVSNYQSDILNYGDSDKSFDEVYSEYKSAKAELLKRLS